MTSTTDPTAVFDELPPEQLGEYAAQFLHAWNSHDPSRLIALSHPDVLREDPFIADGGKLIGHDALRGWLESVWVSMPELTFEIDGSLHLALDRPSVMVGWPGTGTMTGPLDPPGFAPTHGRVEMTGADTHWLRNGLLAHVRTVTDVMTVGRQIGAAPAPGSAAERFGTVMQHLAARKMRRATGR